MITRLFSRAALHQHADPAQRVLGVAELAPGSEDLANLLTADPEPQVRSAAAARVADPATLATALEKETDATVREALVAALSAALAQTPDRSVAQSLLEAAHCSDAIRSDVARQAEDAERRRLAIGAIAGEEALVELALSARHAETRMAAAERVHTPEGLRRLADAAKNRDHGVARLARQRIDAAAHRQDQAGEADAILGELEALAVRPGSILSAVVDLNRRWQVLDMSGDPGRLARCDAARQVLQARFDRENDEQRARAGFARRLRETTEMPEGAPAPEAIDELRGRLAALRAEAEGFGDGAALARLDQAELVIAGWEQQRREEADAEALVVEAELLAAGTSIDNAKLPERWQALDRAIRTPPLTQRFEAALVVIEQRRLEQIRLAQQEATATRQHFHDLLHVAEQSLAAGQLQAARAAVDEVRAKKAGAGVLPKPTTQRLGRVVQQLTDLERWESFGQNTARVQLCERAEEAATHKLDLPQLALEVKKLRAEWKTLDQQYAGVPKALWERFDRACEKAYAPAARHFAELAAQRTKARKEREEFIALAAEHAPTLLAEPRDWRAIERWLRDTDRKWHEGDLGSVDPGAWKKLDAKLRTALAPLRDALATARDEAKAARQQLIDEVTALAAQAMERDAPARVKAIQAKWQEQAKSMSLAQRDERALWERFRAACDAVFEARQSKRKEDDGRKSEARRALEELCVQMDELARATDRDEQEIRRALRDLTEQWKAKAGRPDPALSAVESRFRNARTAVEAQMSTRARSREAAVWQTLAAKERLCEALDRAVGASPEAETGTATATSEAWAALPALPAAWEKTMLARRDAAQAALSDATAATALRGRIDAAAGARREILLELEMALGLESPPELQALRLALQVKRLRDRFQSAPAGGAATPGDRLLAWCAQHGVADAADRARSTRIFAAIERAR